MDRAFLRRMAARFRVSPGAVAMAVLPSWMDGIEEGWRFVLLFGFVAVWFRLW